MCIHERRSALPRSMAALDRLLAEIVEFFAR
jgi:hypothetical protein